MKTNQDLDKLMQLNVGACDGKISIYFKNGAQNVSRKLQLIKLFSVII